VFNPNQPNILDEDLLQDDDTLQEDGKVHLHLTKLVS
jgi:hypothetical protein